MKNDLIKMMHPPRNWYPTRREKVLFHDFVKGDTTKFLLQKYDHDIQLFKTRYCFKNDEGAISAILRWTGRYYERFYGNKTKAFYINDVKKAFRDFTNGVIIREIQARFGWSVPVLGKKLREVGELYETFYMANRIFDIFYS